MDSLLKLDTCILKLALEPFSTRKLLFWKMLLLCMWVRFSHPWNGVVGKLRDSRGRKEIGEIPQDEVRGSSALPHRKASCFQATPDAQHGNEPRKHLKTESSTILPVSSIT
ncbi:hypothetical protein DYE48_03215 [Halobacillus trueperi]|uniref:Uncharacterized protein n=1 Tax=Halobacillus trueperi TaxID=156205 RepID=A0A3E0JC40_9BACI|nr:hypothetical protein DYE48_03215 [Halobacillus trueperi]